MSRDAIIDLARVIDQDRAESLAGDLGTGAGRELGVLLGTAFPPMAPRQAWQIEAIEGIAAHGWQSDARRERTVELLFTAAGDLISYDGVVSGLRRAVWAQKARIAIRELLPPALGGVDVDVTARELSFVAEAAFEVAQAEATAFVARQVGEPLRSDGEKSTMVTLGMGKLGGEELNAGSDVDVIFFYDTDDGADSVDLHQYWTRVARRIVKTIEEPSSDPFVWRVDLRLRPEGSQGPVVNSVAAAERYYETWGRRWERAAMLRARPISGDRELGALVDRELLKPFVFRRDVDPSMAGSLAELVHKSRAELCTNPDRDLKLGPGGIREAEFFIQALQLIWGGKEPSLRVQGSLDALTRLKGQGLVTDQEERHISSAYLMLRRLEHRVQWATGIQTHELPDDPEELSRLARSLGYESDDELLLELHGAQRVVGEHFSSLAPGTPRPAPRYQTLLGALDRGDDEALDRAVATAFAEEVGGHLRALSRRPDGLLGRLTLEEFPDLGDQLLDSIAESADPEQAARYLRRFINRFVSPRSYVERLGADPRATARLVTVLGASAFVGEAVVSRPDLADITIFGGPTRPGDAKRAMALAFDTFERIAKVDPDERRDAFVSAVRRAKGKMMVAVAVADLAGEIETREATRVLSEVADEAIHRTVVFELDSDRGLAVIAVGKLGGCDIGYGSDLDVLFIYDPDATPAGHDPAEYYSRKAQRIIRLISMPHPAGRGYELDTRLRPSGSQGLLVTSLEAFARYHGVVLHENDGSPTSAGVRSSGAAWERQALLRARPCAGDSALGERFMRVAETAAYERGAAPAAELHELRMRMQSELADERPGRWDLKTGAGGLLDIEFAVQWLQMSHGRSLAIRTTDIVEALEALRSRDHLDEFDYEAFREGYTFLRRLEQRIHVQSGIGSSVIDVGHVGLTTLARRMDLRGTGQATAVEALLSRYQAVTRAVRTAYQNVLEVS